MRNTKRLLSLILALVMCLAMTACASEEEKAFEAADALLAAGDYEGAIDAFSSIPSYQEISAKIEEAEKLRMEAEKLAHIANAQPLHGSWINADADSFGIAITLDIKPDGNCTVVWGDTVTDSDYSCMDNTFSIRMMGIDLKVEAQDGVTHLVNDEFNMDFVSEADYSAFALQEIELTIDNWQEYFELKEVNSIRENAFGEVESVYPTVGIFLKEEYYSRLPQYIENLNIAFELTYDETAYVVTNCTPEEFNWEFAGQYEREPATKLPSWWEVPTGCTANGQVNDNRGGDWIPEESPYYNTLSCEIYALGSAGGDREMYLNLWTNVQMNRVIGTLPLFPAK